MSILVFEKNKVLNFCQKLPSATSYLTRLIKKKITVSEYVTQCIRNIDRYEKMVHAWAHFNREAVLQRASMLDQLIHDRVMTIGKVFSDKMFGIPVAIKDIFNTADMKTEHGSPIFSEYTPGNDARVVTDIRRSNGIIMGKTKTAELCVHTPSATRNPWDTTRTPGTSSSGSAVAVATGMVPLALASQTNGSTIRPASYCGVIGYKPSFGVLPRTAMLKTTDTLDTVGIMGTYLSDILMLFNVLRVKGLNYPIVHQKLIHYPKKKMRWQVGVIQSPYSDHQSPIVNVQLKEIADQLSNFSCDVTFFDLPALFKNSYQVHTTIYHRALAYYFKQEWKAHPGLFSQGMSNIMKEGSEIPAKAYHEACTLQTGMIDAFSQLFNQFDILMCPSAASEAPIETDEGIPPDYNHLVTLSHSPTISLPWMRGSSGLPIGIQFIAKKYHDYQLFDFCQDILSEKDPHAIS